MRYTKLTARLEACRAHLTPAKFAAVAARWERWAYGGRGRIAQFAYRIID